MKKLFAIFAVVCLFAATNMFADSWTNPDGTGTGNYSATVLCLPHLTGGGSYSLGSYFQGTTAVAVPENTTAQKWVLDGPAVPYVITFSDGTTIWSASASAIALSTTDNNVLKGDLVIPTNFSSMDCTTANAVDITFTPTHFTPIDIATTSTFNLTVAVTVTI